MKTKEQNLIKLIKNFNIEDLDTINLVYGKENFLKKQLVEKIKTQKNSGFHFFWGDDLQIPQLKDVFSNSSLFSSGDIVIIWDINQFIQKLSKKQLEEFLELLNTVTPPDKLVLVSLQEKIPKKEPYKTILEKANIYTAPSLSSKAFMVSVKKKIEKEGLKIDDDTLLYLLSKLKKDLYHAKQEIEKLIIYTKEKKSIEKTDIDQIVYPKIEENVFSFIDKFFKKEEEVLEIFQALIQTSHHPFEIQSMILTYANRLLMIKTMQKQNIPHENIFQKLGINHPFMKTNLKKLAQNLEENQLIDLIRELYELEIKQKVRFEEPSTSFEEFLIKWLKLIN
ncbi:MAG: DNA polymerase III subunit delta [Aquificae bacterium]|nr:DNA polymerase III subunit delta [Aquificota bacterium]